jgi:hypothetical protein
MNGPCFYNKNTKRGEEAGPAYGRGGFEILSHWKIFEIKIRQIW